MWRAGGPARLTKCSGLYGLMEVAAVSLSAHEQRTLSGIADELAASDPKLASILSVFNRLTRDEELPIRRDTDKSRHRESGRSRGSRGRTRKHRRNRPGTGPRTRSTPAACCPATPGSSSATATTATGTSPLRCTPGAESSMRNPGLCGTALPGCAGCLAGRGSPGCPAREVLHNRG